VRSRGRATRLTPSCEIPQHCFRSRPPAAQSELSLKMWAQMKPPRRLRRGGLRRGGLRGASPASGSFFCCLSPDWLWLSTAADRLGRNHGPPSTRLPVRSSRSGSLDEGRADESRDGARGPQIVLGFCVTAFPDGSGSAPGGIRIFQSSCRILGFVNVEAFCDIALLIHVEVFIRNVSRREVSSLFDDAGDGEHPDIHALSLQLIVETMSIAAQPRLADTQRGQEGCRSQLGGSTAREEDGPLLPFEHLRDHLLSAGDPADDVHLQMLVRKVGRCLRR